MWSSNAFLKRCEKLKELGLSAEPDTGMRVARGFADLGYEEFYCLSNKKLVSIFTGHLSDLTSEHARFFFEIPPVEELIDRILKQRYDVEAFTYVDQRVWSTQFRHTQSGELLETSDREFSCSIAEALLHIAQKGRQ
ncbi:MAG: hypothetical protein J0M12_03800 [Deltaproteobacteria bacterium]|nr:hypothetical protein [Deltaproteobacteria bacterium]